MRRILPFIALVLLGVDDRVRGSQAISLPAGDPVARAGRRLRGGLDSSIDQSPNVGTARGGHVPDSPRVSGRRDRRLASLPRADGHDSGSGPNARAGPTSFGFAGTSCRAKSAIASGSVPWLPATRPPIAFMGGSSSDRAIELAQASTIRNSGRVLGRYCSLRRRPPTWLPIRIRTPTKVCCACMPIAASAAASRTKPWHAPLWTSFGNRRT